MTTIIILGNTRIERQSYNGLRTRELRVAESDRLMHPFNGREEGQRSLLYCIQSHHRDGAEGERGLNSEGGKTNREREGNMPRRKAVMDLAIFEQRGCANAPSANDIKHKSAATSSNFGGRMDADGQSYEVMMSARLFSIQKS